MQDLDLKNAHEWVEAMKRAIRNHGPRSAIKDVEGGGAFYVVDDTLLFAELVGDDVLDLDNATEFDSSSWGDVSLDGMSQEYTQALVTNPEFIELDDEQQRHDQIARNKPKVGQMKKTLSGEAIDALVEKYLDTDLCTDDVKVGICGTHSFAQAVIEAYQAMSKRHNSDPLREGPEVDGFVAWAVDSHFDVSRKNNKKQTFKSKLTRRLLKAWQAGILNDKGKKREPGPEGYCFFNNKDFKDQQALFIQWAKKEGLKVRFIGGGDDNFRSELTHNLWEAWQDGVLFARKVEATDPFTLNKEFQSKPLIDWPTEFCFDGFVAWADGFCFDVSLKDNKRQTFKAKFTRQLLKAWQAGILNENKKDASNLEEDHFSLAEYDEQRTQFIAWAKEQERGINVKRTKDGDDNFRSETTHSLWEAWQAGTLFSRRHFATGHLAAPPV